MEDQLVKVVLKLSDEFGSDEEREVLYEIEDAVAEALETQGIGEYDGNEIGESEFTFYMYGPSADRIWDAVRPLFTKHPPSRGSYASKRYGGPETEEERIELAGG